MTALAKSPLDQLLERGGQRAWRILHSALKNQDPYLWTGGDGRVESLTHALQLVADAVEDVTEDHKKTAAKLFPPIAGNIKGPFPPVADSTTLTDKVRITVDEELSLNAWLVLNSPYKFHWFCAGVGTGKSWLAARYVRQRVLSNPETVGLIAANTHTQLTQSTLPHLWEMLDEAGLPYVIGCKPPKEWNAPSTFKGGYKHVVSILVEPGKVAHILTRTLTGWKRIRGVNIGWFVVDEIADAPEGGFKELKRRLRCKKSKKLQGLIFGIPDLPGDNWTWLEFNPEDPRARKYYKVTFQASTEAKHLIGDLWEEYLLPMLRTMGPLQALQELFARIVIDQTGRIYYAYTDGVNNEGCKEYDPRRPIYFTMDFNILSNSPTSAVLVQLHESADGSLIEAHVIDEIVIDRGDTERACREFLKRYSTHRSEVHFYGDASGAQSQTVTEYQVAKDVLYPVFGARLEMPEITHNPLISERVAALNAKLRNALGVASLFISKKCKELLLDLRKVMPDLKKEGKIDKSDAARTHTSDALGYLLRFLFPPVEYRARRRSLNVEV